MAQDGFTIDMGFNPVLNVDKLNVMLNHVKQSLGSLGSDIKMIDGNKMAADMKKFDTELVQAGKHTDGLKKGFKETEGSLGKLKEGLKQGFNIAVGMGGFELLKEGFKEIVKGGVEFQASLADLSALTGVSGKALDGLGGRAREMSKEFGTTAVQQITSMKGVLSRFGPDLAKTPESLAAITKSINILGEASGMDAATSMDALTNSMLQFGVDITNPATAAKESARFINVLGASAKEGAAEIPQISEAIVNAGVACQQSNVSFEMANAALQVLAQGGKTGAEAGIGLRNVLMKISSIKMIPPDVRKDLQGLGVDLGIVTNSALPLNVRMKELQKGAKDAGTMTKLWGLENATTGALLIKGADQMDTFNKKMTGTNVAYDQARINSQTFEAQVKRLKSTMQDLLISGFQAVQPAIGLFLGGLTWASKNIGAVLVPMGLLTAAFILYKATAIQTFAIQAAKNIQDGISLAWTAAKTIATNIATAAQWLWNAAMSANPIGLIIIGVAALVGGLMLLGGSLKRTAEATIKDSQEKIKGIKTQEAVIGKNKEHAEANIKLAESFKAQGEKAMQNKDLMLKLAKAFPGVIDETKSYKVNLENLTKASNTASDDIKKMNDRLMQLQSREIHLNVIITEQKVKKQIEELITTAAGSRNGVLQNAFDRLSGWQTGEEYAKAALYNYTKVLDNSKSKEEVAKAGHNLQVALYDAMNGKSKLKTTGGVIWTPDKETAQNMINSIPQIMEGAYKRIDSQNAEYNNKIINEYNSLTQGMKIADGKYDAATILRISKEKKTGELEVIAILDNAKRKADAKAAADAKALADANAGGDPKPTGDKKATKSAYEKALKQYEEINKLKEDGNTLDAQNKVNSDKRSGIIKSDLQTEQEKLDISKKATEEIQRQITEFGNVKVKAKSADEKSGAEEILRKLGIDLAQSEGVTADINLKIGKINMDSDAELKKLGDELSRRKLEIAVKMGIKPEIDLINFDKAALQTQLDKVVKKIAETTDPNTKIELQINKANIEGQIYDKNIELSDANEKIRLNNIKDSAKLECETRISEAKKTLKQQLFDVKGNINLEMAARSEYYLKLNDAEKAFAATQRTNIFGLQVPLNLMAMSFGASLNDVFANLSFSTGDSQKTTELKDQKNKLKTEEDALFESLRKREISQRDYYDKLTDLQNQQKELTKEIAAEQTSVWKEMGSALGKSMQSLGTAGLGESLVKYKDNSVIIQGIDKEITDKKAEQLLRQLELAEISTQLDDKKRAELTAKQKQTSDELIDLEKRKSDAIDISSAASNKAYTSMAITAIGATAELIANGKLTWKSLLLTGINALQNMVPLWSAQILGMEFASKGILGAITAGAAVLALNVAVAVAKAAVSGAKFFKGGPTAKGNSYDVAGTVHKNEFVFDHVMTGKYGDEFEKRHKEGLSATAYVTKYEPEFLAKVAEKNGKESQEYKVMISQNQELIYENKELRKELIRNTEEVQNLKATFSHNSAVKVTGTFKAEGDDFRANIEKSKQVTMARS